MLAAHSPTITILKRSVRSKIIVLLLCSAASLLIINSFYSYLSQRQALQHELLLTADNIANRLSFTMAQPLWDFDLQYLERLALQELKAPELLSVLVLAADQEFPGLGHRKTLSDPARIETFQSLPPEQTGTLHREKAILYHNQTIGTVHITLTNQGIRNKLSALLIQQLLQALIILGSLTLLTYFGLSRLLLAPLRELYQAAVAFGKADFSTRIKVITDDEIGNLAATLNTMAVQLEKTISGLQVAENNLRSSNRRLHDIIEFIPDAMFVIDNQGVVIAWNHAMEELSGYSSEQMLGKGNKEYAIPFFGERRPILIDLLDLFQEDVASQYKYVQRSNDKLYAESLIPVLNGKTNLHLWGVASPLYNEQGERIGAIEVIRDITEQKIAEHALKESEAFQRLIFESSPIAIAIVDFETLAFVDSNPANVKLNGLTSPEELIGKNMLYVSAQTQANGSQSRDMIPSLINRALTGESCVFEWRQCRPNGEEWDAEIHMMLFRLGGRKLMQFIVIDITERKNTAAVMIQTEKMMMVGGLAAGMAHEINNPLGIIAQSAQNIQRRLDTDLPVNRAAAEQAGMSETALLRYLEQRQIITFIKNIRDAAERAARIIANMLKFSRKSESHTEYMDLAELVEQSIELAAGDYDLKKSYDFKRIEIIRDFSNDLPLIPVSALEIEQVILNLLKNASQALYEAKTDHPQITLHTSKDNGYAILQVRDNGPGITSEVKKRIFEPFYTTKEVGRGTGLGLFVSYSIITNNHQGTIQVDSKPGQGTCFSIRLPFQRTASRIPQILFHENSANNW